MKLLHTADWHIGAKWKRIDRSTDLLERAIPDMVEMALAEKVDMVLVAGDVFERQTSDSLQQAAQTLGRPFRELLDAQIEIVLLVGNHDSPPLFRFLRSAIELVGNKTGRQGKLHILNSPWVNTIAGLQIVSLPYMRAEQVDRVLKDSETESPDTIEMANWKLGRKLDQVATELRKGLDHSRPAVMAYHGVVKGATAGLDENAPEITYHQAYMLSSDSLLFNDQVPQYNALGHIHKYQELSGAVPTYYSGSIDRFNRGEKAYQPSVMLVEIPNNGRRASCERRVLPRPTPFLEEKVGNERELNALRQKLGQKACQLALGRITLTCEPTDSYALEQAVRDTFPRLRHVKEAVLRPRNVTTELGVDNSISSIKELGNPGHTIRRYIHKHLPAEQHQDLLHALSVIEKELSHDN